MKPRHIELHIDELVLDGFKPGTEGRIQSAMERELARLLRHDAMSTQGGTRSQRAVDAGSIENTSATDPEATGRELARALRRSLGE